MERADRSGVKLCPLVKTAAQRPSEASLRLGSVSRTNSGGDMTDHIGVHHVRRDAHRIHHGPV
ncbi:unannotated protein [freshwater metagenome]|uniref:Unannotated protein n=1 Tax=freshwater metagenome TaxID=449393 RepID=A0A6J6GPB7_9ZZZZ